MLLLTGASGLIGSALRRRLIAAEVPLRCLVRDPRRLGDDRVRVQIALGDLADPPSFRNALRGVDTVVHLAATIRDQPQGSIEELSGIATCGSSTPLAAPACSGSSSSARWACSRDRWRRCWACSGRPCDVGKPSQKGR